MLRLMEVQINSNFPDQGNLHNKNDGVSKINLSSYQVYSRTEGISMHFCGRALDKSGTDHC